jgi:hypothetical protein
LDEARLLFEKTTEAFQVVNDYAKKYGFYIPDLSILNNFRVKTEIQQSESLKTQLISLDSFLKIESQYVISIFNSFYFCYLDSVKTYWARPTSV